MENKDEDDILFGWDCDNDFDDDGTTTADQELNGVNRTSGTSSTGFVFVDAKDLLINPTKKKPNFTHRRTQSASSSSSDEAIQPQPDAAIYIPVTHTNPNINLPCPSRSPTDKSPRSLSSFRNNNFDIVSFGAAPLKIANINCQMNNTYLESLEYLQCSMPDLHSLYWSTVWTQITKSQKQVKCANFRATKQSITNVMNHGGCKILQFMAHCCNPKKMKEYEACADSRYKHLISAEMRNSNQDYLLLESDENIIAGEWLNINELKTLFKSEYNDIVIVLSPEHTKMVEIFSKLGYKYIVGIKTFNENVPKHSRDNNNWKISQFLTHFYSAILDGECIRRSYELAITASSSQDRKTQLLEQDVLKKLLSTESVMDELQKSEKLFMQRTHTIGQNKRFTLHIGEDCDPRFVAFHDYKENCDPIDVSNLSMYSSCAHLQYDRPFLGRSKELIQLYEAVRKYQVVSCIGRKNYGRRSVIIKLMNYLQQHRYFKHGIMIIDCEKEQARYLFDDIMDNKFSQHFANINASVFKDLLVGIQVQIPDISMCIVILNVDAWKNKYRDPREWIKQFALKMPKTCKCIYTDDWDNLFKSRTKLPLTGNESTISENLSLSDQQSTDSDVEYNKYIIAMDTFFTSHNFTANNIDKLSKSKLSQLFMNLIDINKNKSPAKFKVQQIEQHEGLQKKFDGKARFVKRAAAWVSKLQTSEDMELTLNTIHDKLPDEWIGTPRAAYTNDLPNMAVNHSHSIAPFNFNKHLTAHASTLQQGLSVWLPDEKIAIDAEDQVIDDTISKIRNATDVSQLIEFITQRHLGGLKKMLLADYQLGTQAKNGSIQQNITVRLSNISSTSRDSGQSLNFVNNYTGNTGHRLGSFKSAASFQLTPMIPPEIISGREGTPFPTNIPNQNSIAYQISKAASNHSLPSLHSADSAAMRVMFDATVPVVATTILNNQSDRDQNLPLLSNITSQTADLCFYQSRSNKMKNHLSNTLVVPAIWNRTDQTVPLLDKNGENSETVLLSLYHSSNTISKNSPQVLNRSDQTLIDHDYSETLDEKNDKQNRKVSYYLIPVSQTSTFDDEAVSTEVIKDNEIDSNILFKMNKKVQEIWKKVCCNHNPNIAQLCNLQKLFKETFSSITNLKHQIPQLVKLDAYYLNSFEIFKCETLNNELVIKIFQFRKFWKWLQCLCHLIFKFKKMYKIIDVRYDNNNQFGMLIGKQNANSILCNDNNVKNGAFILYIDADNFGQLNLLYRNSNNNLQEIVIKYNKKEKYFTIDNKKDNPISFIKRTTRLKFFYCSTRKGLMKKKILLKHL